MHGANGTSDGLDDLLRRIGRGDNTAFDGFYEQTYDRVYAIVRRVLIDPALSEDTAQEVYLQIWHSADTFDPVLGGATTWVGTIAHRRAVDKVRLEQNHTNREARYASGTHVVEHDVVEEAVRGKLESEAILSCLASLTHIQRESITMAYYEGLSYPEVAEKLGIGLPTVKSRVRAGLLRLYICMAD